MKACHNENLLQHKLKIDHKLKRKSEHVNMVEK